MSSYSQLWPLMILLSFLYYVTLFFIFAPHTPFLQSSLPEDRCLHQEARWIDDEFEGSNPHLEMVGCLAPAPPNPPPRHCLCGCPGSLTINSPQATVLNVVTGLVHWNQVTIHVRWALRRAVPLTPAIFNYVESRITCQQCDACWWYLLISVSLLLLSPFLTPVQPVTIFHLDHHNSLKTSPSKAILSLTLL